MSCVDCVLDSVKVLEESMIVLELCRPDEKCHARIVASASHNSKAPEELEMAVVDAFRVTF